MKNFSRQKKKENKITKIQSSTRPVGPEPSSKLASERPSTPRFGVVGWPPSPPASTGKSAVPLPAAASSGRPLVVEVVTIVTELWLLLPPLPLRASVAGLAVRTIAELVHRLTKLTNYCHHGVLPLPVDLVASSPAPAPFLLLLIVKPLLPMASITKDR